MDAAVRYSIPVGWFYDVIRERKVPVVRAGSYRYMQVKALEEIINSRRVAIAPGYRPKPAET